MGNSACLTWIRLQQPQERLYPFLPVCAVFLCPKQWYVCRRVGFFSKHVDVDERDCDGTPTPEPELHKRVCSESWYWEKSPLPCWGVELVLVLSLAFVGPTFCQSHIPTPGYWCHPLFPASLIVEGGVSRRSWLVSDWNFRLALIFLAYMRWIGLKKKCIRIWGEKRRGWSSLYSNRLHYWPVILFCNFETGVIIIMSKTRVLEKRFINLRFFCFLKEVLAWCAVVEWWQLYMYRRNTLI